MIKPNYKNGSIINLISSVMEKFGSRNGYRPLNIKLDKKNIILFLIDGLGYEYLMKNGTFLKEKCVRSLTSTFPSTTTCAAIGIQKGVPAQQHGLTGWFMNSKEIGTIISPLPFNARFGSYNLNEMNFNFESICSEKQVSEKIKGNSVYIFPKKIVGKSILKGRKKVFAYDSLEGLFKQIKKAVNLPGKKYIHAYWPDFDSMGHELGIANEELLEHFKELEERIQKLKLKDTQLLITADHGMIDANKKIINLKENKKFYECLSMPLSGEPRFVYCYVRLSKVKQFLLECEKYKKYFLVHKSEDLVKKNYFGLGKVNPKLLERIGDFTLLMKKDYIAFDCLDNEEFEMPIGNHGGLTKQEMLVPLIVINSD